MSPELRRFYDFALAHNHNAARALEADRFEVVEVAAGRVVVDCHLPQTLLNLGDTLFGGFTPTYVDFVSIWTCMTMVPGEVHWFSTVNLRVDYLEPIAPPGFRLSGQLVNVRQRDYLVESRFADAAGKLLAFGLTNLRKARERRLDLE